MAALSPGVASAAFEDQDINQRAAKAALSEKTRVVAGPVAVNVPVSRVTGMSKMRTALNAAEKPGDAENVINAEFSPVSGRLRSLHAYIVGARGLVNASPVESLDDAFGRFLISNGEMFDLAGSAARTRRDLDWLQPPDVAVGEEGGHKLTKLTYQQRCKGVPVSDGEIVVVFIDDRMISMAGSLVNPAGVTVTPKVNATSAAKNADSAVRQKFGGDYVGGKTTLRFNAEFDRFEYFTPFATAYSSVTGVSKPNVWTTVDATTGEALQTREDIAETSSANGMFRIFKPLSSDPNPLRQNVTDVGHNVMIDGNIVRPWRDIGSGKSPVISFSYPNLNGSQSQSFFNSLGNNNFLANPFSNQFAQQQASYWTQNASNLVEAFYGSFPPNASYRHLAVAIVSEHAPSGFNSHFSESGCPNTQPDSWDGTPCILMGNTGSDSVYPGTSIPAIGTIFHEHGHFVDYKYRLPGAPRWANPIVGTCQVGTAEEGPSVSETFAGLLGVSAMISNFNITTAFTDLNGDRSNLHSLGGNAGPHEHNNLLSCYKQTSDCSYGNTHHFGAAMEQSVWESVHSVNCFVNQGTPCTNITQVPSNPVLAARKAIQYTVSVSPSSATLVTASGAFLDYYYYFVSNGSWTDRWWIFNHHNLVGPAYGYSPCHAP